MTDSDKAHLLTVSNRLAGKMIYSDRRLPRGRPQSPGKVIIGGNDHDAERLVVGSEGSDSTARAIIARGEH